MTTNGTTAFLEKFFVIYVFISFNSMNPKELDSQLNGQVEKVKVAR